MQQLFQCNRCGSQNYVGQQYCYNCQQKIQYKCSNCNGLVEVTMINCPYCRVVLPWPTPHKGNYGHSPQQPTQKKKTNPFGIIAIVSLVLTVICLLVDVIIGPPIDWESVAKGCVVIFLGIFAIGTLILFIKHIINRKQSNPWRTGAILLVVIVGLIIVISIFSANRTSQISSHPPVTSPTPVVEPAPIRHDISMNEIMSNSAYWNTAWQDKHSDLVNVTKRINQQYLRTHTYIKGETDCNDMAIDIWNMLQTQGIVSIIVAGNVDDPAPLTSLNQCNHAFLLIFNLGEGESTPRAFFLEPTNGQCYFSEDFERNPQLKLYLYRGFYYTKPSDLKADLQDRW
ncbi:MAG: zinc ribbon domain-containing protein [Dehalococcoidia bacterium]